MEGGPRTAQPSPAAPAPPSPPLHPPPGTAFPEPICEQTDLMQAGAGRLSPDKQAVARRGRVSWCQGGHGVGGITPGVTGQLGVGARVLDTR